VEFLTQSLPLVLVDLQHFIEQLCSSKIRSVRPDTPPEHRIGRNRGHIVPGLSRLIDRIARVRIDTQLVDETMHPITPVLPPKRLTRAKY
jgi:hypothetical protein